MLHRYSLSITERKRLLFLTRRRSIVIAILQMILCTNYYCKDFSEAFLRHMTLIAVYFVLMYIVILCKIWWIMVGMAWTGAPCPGFRHSHAPGQGGGMATMLLCYLLRAAS